MNNLDRFAMEFWHFNDKKMYKVISLCSKFKDEDFLRVFIDKELTKEERDAECPQNYKTGIIASRDIDAYATSIKEILEDKRMLDYMSDYSYSYANDIYSNESIYNSPSKTR